MEKLYVKSQLVLDVKIRRRWNSEPYKDKVEMNLSQTPANLLVLLFLDNLFKYLRQNPYRPYCYYYYSLV